MDPKQVESRKQEEDRANNDRAKERKVTECASNFSYWSDQDDREEEEEDERRGIVGIKIVSCFHSFPPTVCKTDGRGISSGALLAQVFSALLGRQTNVMPAEEIDEQRGGEYSRGQRCTYGRNTRRSLRFLFFSLDLPLNMPFL